MTWSLQLLAKKSRLPREELLDEQLEGGRDRGEEDRTACDLPGLKRFSTVITWKFSGQEEPP